MDAGLILAPDGSSADIAIQDGAIVLDGTLATSVLLSLLCDRLADADDVIPDGSTNRRGWWYDSYAPPLPDGSPDYWGSKLWLRLRSLATPQTALAVQNDCEVALAWMIADGVAVDVEVSTEWASATALAVTIVISRMAAGGAPYNSTFSVMWDRTLGLLPVIQGPGFALELPQPRRLAVGAGSGLARNPVVPPAGIVFSTGTSFGTVIVGEGLLWNQATATLSLDIIPWDLLPPELGYFPLMMSIPGKPAAYQRYLFSLPQAYAMPQNMGGISVKADVLATGVAIFGLSYIRGGVETEIGTITFSSGGTTVSASAYFLSQPGDALVLTAPVSQDPTLSGVAISLIFHRV